MSNLTGRKEPGKPGTRPPGVDSPIGGGCLSANREGTRPGSWFPVPPLPGGFVRKPGLSFHPLPPCFRLPCIRGAGVFLSSCQCSPGCPLRCGLSGYPAPVYPGGGSGSRPANGTGEGEPGNPARPANGTGAGCRGLPPGGNRIHPFFFGGCPRFYPIIQ